MTRVPLIIAAMATLTATQAAALGMPSDVIQPGAWQFLPLGFAVGMLHALEADHLAAVATMFRSGADRRKAMARGSFWGLGHTAALFVICGFVMLLGLTISHRVEAALEAVVGFMILALGAKLIIRLRREKAHIHVHEHDGEKHLHFHSHKATGHGTPRAHQHSHKRISLRPGLANLKALSIGLVHGAAGSAALLVVLVASTHTLPQAMTYLLVFGAGSIAGMSAISLVISLPLAMVEKGAARMRSLTTAAIGLGAIWVGGALCIKSLGAIAAAMS